MPICTKIGSFVCYRATCMHSADLWQYVCPSVRHTPVFCRNG